MKALLKNYHQSPRKVRLVADMIRGKSVVDARTALAFMPQKSSPAILKLLNSAVANARTKGIEADTLVVKSIAVNKGVASRRFKPMARGRSTRFSRTMSIVTIELGTQSQKQSVKIKVKNDNAKSRKKKTEKSTE